jgi:hypothetical protein
MPYLAVKALISGLIIAIAKKEALGRVSRASYAETSKTAQRDRLPECARGR